VTGIALPLEELTEVAGITAGVSLSPAFRLGTDDLDVNDFFLKVPGLRPHRLDPVRVVLDETMSRYQKADAAASDTWLGPRLHAALRLSKREAGSRDVWRFMGLWAADYVRWRFGQESGVEDPDKAAPTERFVGPDSKHALARLWWMSELFRDGKNYAAAALALTNQDIINNLFRMRIAKHRPTALAALAVLPLGKDGQSLSDGRRANALAKAANAAASTLLFDMMGLDDQYDAAARAHWESVRNDHDPRSYFDALPEGPDDCVTAQEAVEAMKKLLADLLAEAPVRGSKSARASTMNAPAGLN
jgi:hypothetical protein